MQETELIVIRHGETNWNAAGRVQGFLDAPLNERGLKQARWLGNRLAGEPMHAIYSSDLARTRGTAAPLARRKRMAVRTDVRLREWNLGVFENLTIPEARLACEEGYHAYRQRRPDFVIPGGESLRGFAARCLAGVEAIVAGHPGERVVVVTHGGVLLNMMLRARDVPIHEPVFYAIPNVARIDFRFGHQDGIVWQGFESEAPIPERVIPVEARSRT